MKRLSLLTYCLVFAITGACSFGATITVTTTNDAGAGSLRQAILDSNASVGVLDTIAFDIPGTGVQTIAPASDLPRITDPVIIDGYTQPGSSVNTLTNGDNAVLLIELNESHISIVNLAGLDIRAGNCTVRGLVINRVSATCFDVFVGISLSSVSSNCVIEGNFIGTDPSGTNNLESCFAGIEMSGNNSVIGGSGPASRNVIVASCYPCSCVSIGGNGNIIEGNFLGTDKDGTRGLGHSGQGNVGVSFGGQSNVVVHNLISGMRNSSQGDAGGAVAITGEVGFPASGNRIQGNLIGTDVTGTTAVSNSSFGVYLSDLATNNLIGGTAPGEGNVIAFTSGTDLGCCGYGSGVAIVGFNATPADNAILGNAIFSNEGLGIDLVGTNFTSGVTTNDPCDTDIGANNQQNFPVLTFASNTVSGTLIEGFLDSTPSTTFRLEFFANTACNTNGFGEGEFFLGATNVTTGVDCTNAFTFVSANMAAVGQFITATATDPFGNTSEFSACAPVTGGASSPCTTVTTLADNGLGSLRAALACASNGDVIDATSITGTILLTSGELVVSNSVTILGPGPANLAVDGNAASRVFHIAPSNTVTISSLTVSNGATGGDNGAGIYNDHSTLTVSNCTLSGNSATFNGGGIFNDGSSGSATLTVANSTLSSNSAGNVGGGIDSDGLAGNATVTVSNSTLSGNSAAYSGGGIFNDGFAGSGTLTVASCTLSGNSAGYGGGVFNDGVASGSATLTVANSTFSGNSATSYGGGIYNIGAAPSSATLTVANSTLSGNSAGLAGGGILNYGQESGGATLTIGDTILKTGSSGANVINVSGSVGSDGYNLSSDDGGGFLAATGDQINTDPMLGPLQDNGGPTFTHALLHGSPAIDAGNRAAIPALALDTDQRGFPRPAAGSVTNAGGGDGSDIGAFEVQGAVSCPTITVAPSSLPDGTAGVSYNQTITASGSAATPISFAVTSGALPSGFDLSSAGTLSGAPSTQGISSFTVTATDTNNCTGSRAYTLTINPATSQCPDMTGVWSNLVQTCKTTTKGLQCKVNGSLLVQNIGTADAPTSFVQFYLSSDGVATSTLLKQVATGTIKNGKPKKKKLSAKLPPGVNGSGQFIIAVIDADNTVAECNENNNVIVFGPLP